MHAAAAPRRRVRGASAFAITFAIIGGRRSPSFFVIAPLLPAMAFGGFAILPLVCTGTREAADAAALAAGGGDAQGRRPGQRVPLQRRHQPDPCRDGRVAAEVADEGLLLGATTEAFHLSTDNPPPPGAPPTADAFAQVTSSDFLRAIAGVGRPQTLTVQALAGTCGATKWPGNASPWCSQRPGQGDRAQCRRKETVWQALADEAGRRTDEAKRLAAKEKGSSREGRARTIVAACPWIGTILGKRVFCGAMPLEPGTWMYGVSGTLPAGGSDGASATDPARPWCGYSGSDGDGRCSQGPRKTRGSGMSPGHARGGTIAAVRRSREKHMVPPGAETKGTARPQSPLPRIHWTSGTSRIPFPPGRWFRQLPPPGSEPASEVPPLTALPPVRGGPRFACHRGRFYAVTDNSLQADAAVSRTSGQQGLQRISG
jgi:hypothetical protein